MPFQKKIEFNWQRQFDVWPWIAQGLKVDTEDIPLLLWEGTIYKVWCMQNYLWCFFYCFFVFSYKEFTTNVQLFRHNGVQKRRTKLQHRKIKKYLWDFWQIFMEYSITECLPYWKLQLFHVHKFCGLSQSEIAQMIEQGVLKLFKWSWVRTLVREGFSLIE